MDSRKQACVLSTSVNLGPRAKRSFSVIIALNTLSIERAELRRLFGLRRGNFILRSNPRVLNYFVDDIPESDIRGRNEFDGSVNSTNNWYSILVRTGVFREENGPNHFPKMTVDNGHYARRCQIWHAAQGYNIREAK